MDRNILNLPPELLEKIFGYLEKANDRRRLAQVCWTFYHVVRRQSTFRCILKLNQTDLEHSPIPVFENSTSFPFAKLYIASSTILNPNHHFWQQNGTQIVEITIENGGLNMDRFLTTWSAYFPNLRKLRIVYGQYWNAGISCNMPYLPLAIEELCIETDSYNLCMIRRLQNITLSLKRLHLAVGDAEMVPDLLEWIEKVDEVTVNAEKVSLGAIATKLALLPSKVVFTTLFVKTDVSSGPKILDEFFEKPRIVETLDIEWRHILMEVGRFGKFIFREHKADSLENEQILSLQKAKSVRHLRIVEGTYNCRKRLDFLAQLPGVETIEVKLLRSNPLRSNTYKLWTTRSTAEKVRSIEHLPNTKLYLEGVGGLTSFTLNAADYVLRYPNGEEIMEALVRNCPNLKTLQLVGIKLNVSNLLQMSSLKHLEKLVLFWTDEFRDEITIPIFEKFFKFPKLKQLEMDCFTLYRKTLHHLATNCPNLERLKLDNVSIDDDGFQRLIRQLPYLMEVRIHNRFHSVTNEMIRKLKMEFSYLKIAISTPS